MIRVTQQDSASGAKRYYAAADYYSEGQELIGLWGGGGAARLGLDGQVDKLSFERLCDNLHPHTGEQLTVRTRTERTVGYDFTFSVPKSVSLLYGMTGDQEILAAFRSAVAETMREMEADMKTRVRRKGQDKDRTTGNLVWAEFIHHTSRPVDGIPDPQLHAHCFVFNTTWDQDEERWKAGQFRELKRDAPYFQAAFRVRLANKLQDLGLREAVELATDRGNLLAHLAGDGEYQPWSENKGVQPLVVSSRDTDQGDVVVDPQGQAYRIKQAGFEVVGPPSPEIYRRYERTVEDKEKSAMTLAKIIDAAERARAERLCAERASARKEQDREIER